MGFGTVLVLVGVAAFAVALVATALTGRWRRVTLIGVVLGVVVWTAEAINIFRGPDNPDLGEFGWTVVAGVVIGGWVAAWLLGTLVGAAVAGRRRVAD